MGERSLCKSGKVVYYKISSCLGLICIVRKLGLVLSFSNRTIQILLTHYASQDWHSSNLLRTCIA